MKSNLLTTLFATLFCLFQQASAQCDLPTAYTGNTGANMTVVLTPGVTSSLPTLVSGAYVVTFTSSSSLLVGSKNFEDIQNGTLAFPVWGVDSTTDDVDGAEANESLDFQLVNGNDLYDLTLSFAGANAYVANAQLPAISVTYTLNCTSVGETAVPGCTDVSATNYDAQATEDNGSCTYAVIDCMNPDACNYNSEATEDDNSCINPVACETCSGETDGTGVVVDNNSDDPCVETSNVATQGSFSEGYTVNFETDGSSVTVTFELLDSDKSGVVAYLWRESPFSETFMSVVSGKKFTTTISNQSPGASISYACKFAYAGGMAV
ncbi:MAG: hypothetical protein NZ604_01525, partial [Flavobacteriales bacterium]|nr:hypothetical protein [Flavobacteriales bacterium]